MGKPYHGRVTYESGTVGDYPIWADSLRDYLRMLHELLVEPEPAVHLEVTLREFPNDDAER
jgi:hypothetical protein